MTSKPRTIKLKTGLLSVLFAVVLVFPGGVVVGYYYLDPEIVVTPGEPITEIKYVPVTVDDYMACYNSAITIKGLWETPFFRVTAQDKCKRTKQSFEIKFPTRKNFVALYPVVGFNFRDFRVVYGGGVSYDREILPVLYAGVGVTVTNQDITVYPRLGFHF